MWAANPLHVKRIIIKIALFNFNFRYLKHKEIIFHGGNKARPMGDDPSITN
jgi:hypothetical protein